MEEKLKRGWQRKLAKRLRCAESSISLVLHGKLQSARISAAIERELARLKKPTGAEAA